MMRNPLLLVLLLASACEAGALQIPEDTDFQSEIRAEMDDLTDRLEAAETRLSALSDRLDVLEEARCPVPSAISVSDTVFVFGCASHVSITETNSEGASFGVVVAVEVAPNIWYGDVSTPFARVLIEGPSGMTCLPATCGEGTLDLSEI